MHVPFRVSPPPPPLLCGCHRSRWQPPQTGAATAAGEGLSFPGCDHGVSLCTSLLCVSPPPPLYLELPPQPVAAATAGGLSLVKIGYKPVLFDQRRFVSQLAPRPCALQRCSRWGAWRARRARCGGLSPRGTRLALRTRPPPRNRERVRVSEQTRARAHGFRV